ncbi:hypothetical protein DPEC_G00364660 [Dallia pectoralis]|nr:hypothetical protein DPEC_G00364660 [Dallia pectoralis]
MPSNNQWTLIHRGRQDHEPIAHATSQCRTETVDFTAADHAMRRLPRIWNTCCTLKETNTTAAAALKLWDIERHGNEDCPPGTAGLMRTVSTRASSGRRCQK